MLVRTSLLASVALLVASLAAPARAAEVDRADPKAVAVAALTAYKAKDMKALTPLSSTANKKIFAELAEKGEAHPRYKSIFGGLRWESVQKWDGTTADAPRYVAPDRAVVRFGDADATTAYVVLKLEDKAWGSTT